MTNITKPLSPELHPLNLKTKAAQSEFIADQLKALRANSSQLVDEGDNGDYLVAETLVRTECIHGTELQMYVFTAMLRHNDSELFPRPTYIPTSYVHQMVRTLCMERITPAQLLASVAALLGKGSARLPYRLQDESLFIGAKNILVRATPNTACRTCQRLPKHRLVSQNKKLEAQLLAIKPKEIE